MVWWARLYTAKNAREINGQFWITTAYVPVYVRVTGLFTKLGMTHTLEQVGCTIDPLYLQVLYEMCPTSEDWLS